MSSRRGEPRGSVLILVLWVVFALAALTVAVGVHAGAVMAISQRLWDSTICRSLAEAGVNQARALVLSQTNAWDGAGAGCWNCNHELLENYQLEQGTFSVGYVTLDADGGSVTNVGVIGEEGRINLNKISGAGKPLVRQTLENLIVDLGGGSLDSARDIVAAITGTTRSDDELTDDNKDSKSGKPLTKDSGSGETSQVFDSPVELQTVAGLDYELYRKLLPYVTVYGDGNININSAPAPVLQALAEACDGRRNSVDVYASLAAKIVAFRNGGGVFDVAKQEAIRNAPGRGAFSGVEKMVWRKMTSNTSVLDIKSTAFRGISTGTREGADSAGIKIEFVFDAKDSKVVYWHEMQ